jgi:hypothetical protein
MKQSTASLKNVRVRGKGNFEIIFIKKWSQDILDRLPFSSHANWSSSPSVQWEVNVMNSWSSFRVWRNSWREFIRHTSYSCKLFVPVFWVVAVFERDMERVVSTQNLETVCLCAMLTNISWNADVTATPHAATVNCFYTLPRRMNRLTPWTKIYVCHFTRRLWWEYCHVFRVTTNNNGFWFGRLDLLTLSFTITLDHQQL